MAIWFGIRPWFFNPWLLSVYRRLTSRQRHHMYHIVRMQRHGALAGNDPTIPPVFDVWLIPPTGRRAKRIDRADDAPGKRRAGMRIIA